MKALKIISGVLLGVILTLGGTCLGITIEKKNIEELEQTTHKITTVAVINLDEGVSVDGKYKYYSGELLALPSADFIITSYDDAMSGVKEGRYGAYVIVPATFSESVESLNGTPTEAFIQYEYDPELSEDAKLIVQENIDLLEDSLIDNVSYVYVSNVMANLHAAQDDAKGVLANDIDDLDSITSIDASELAVQLEYRNLDVVAYEIPNVDVSTYIANNATNIGKIQGVYDDAKVKSDEQISSIKGNLGEIGNNIDDYDQYIDSIDILHDDSGALIVQSELDQVRDKLYISESSREQAKSEIKYELKEQIYCTEKAYQAYVDEQVAAYGQVTNEGISIWYGDVQTSVEASVQQQLDSFIATALANAAADPTYVYTPGDYSVNIAWNTAYSAGALGSIDVSQARNNYVNITYDAEDSAVIESIDSIQLSDDISNQMSEYKIVPDEVISLIDDKIISVYMKEMEKESDKIVREANDIKSDFSTYLNDLSTYDPSKNVDTVALNDILISVNTNNGNMASEVNQNIYDNNEYIYDLQTTTNENIALLRQDMNDTNAATIQNVESAVEALKDNRVSLNKNNVELLTDFTELLPYSRVGELENQRMYSYIVNPVIFDNNPTIEKATPIIKPDERITMIYVCIGSFILMLSFCVIMVAKAKKAKLVEIKSINHKN